jgi:CheY-like chemotaxis protein
MGSDFGTRCSWLLSVRDPKVEAKHFQILAIIYDLDFIIRVRNAFASEPGVNLHVCRSAEEAKLLLRGVGVYAERRHYPLPRLILLDTMTPDRAAHKLLDFLHENGGLPSLPVVLLAAEPNQAGLQELLDHGANGVIAKRDSPDELLNICRSVRALEHLPPATKRFL